MKKRNVFDELVQGFEELKGERKGRLTLRSAEVEALPPIGCTHSVAVAEKKKSMADDIGIMR